MSVSTMHFLIDIVFSLKGIKFYFKSYDKRNFTLMFISYEIYEITTCVRSSICDLAPRL